MYNRNFFDVYIQEKHNLDSEWYNLQQNLIYNENQSIINKTPVVMIRGVINYLYGAKSYFGKMYEVIKTEWNYFYTYYKRNRKILKNNHDNILDLKLNSNIYGIKYNIKTSSVVRYEKLSPTDGFISINLSTLRTLPLNINVYSKSLSERTFNNIRGQMLSTDAITDEDFKNSIYRFYCANGNINKVILDEAYIDNICKCNINELTRVKREIDIFYNSVLSFIDEVEYLISDNGEKRLSYMTPNTDKGRKVIKKYYHIKTVEFREFSQIYNTYFLTLLTVFRDKMQQDIDILKEG